MSEAFTTSGTTAPLLRPRQGAAEQSSRPTTFALLMGRATGRRGPSMLVRETAARELEERRADWGYSKPVVALDMMWNMCFVIVSIVMLICTAREHPNTPIRLWICGYAFQCGVHVVLVWLEYRRRNTRRVLDEERQQTQQQHPPPPPPPPPQHSDSDANDSEDEGGNSSASGVFNQSR